MAETSQNEQIIWIFCHKCSVPSPLVGQSDWECPLCSDGFVELMMSGDSPTWSRDDNVSYSRNFIFLSVGPQLNVHYTNHYFRGNRRGCRHTPRSWPYFIRRRGQLLDTYIEPVMGPLDDPQINEIPTVKITEDQAIRTLQCVICLETFQVSEPVKILPCEHVFHGPCIVLWLKVKATCPICRYALED